MLGFEIPSNSCTSFLKLKETHMDDTYARVEVIAVLYC